MFRYDESNPPNENAWPGSGSDQPPDQTPAQATPDHPKKEPAAFIVNSQPETYAPVTAPETGAGVGVVAVVLGGIAGFLMGSWWGAGAGVLGVGALRNGNRAYQQWRTSGPTPEATKSATVAAIGLAASGWMGYNASHRGEKT